MTELLDAADVLPEDDAEFLKEKYPAHILRQVGSEIHVRLPAFPFPAVHYLPAVANLLLRLPAGYPNAVPDMFWTQPDVKLLRGAWPLNCEHHEVPGVGPGAEVYGNAMWQRWSRHFQGGWIVGRHGLRFFVASIKQELIKGI